MIVSQVGSHNNRDPNRCFFAGWHGESYSHHQGVYDALGEQGEWSFAIPWVYRALASEPLYQRSVGAGHTQVIHMY
jgi:hypothetical protein